jgi:hypothetical protein
MTRKMVPVGESFAAWRKNPAYVKAYYEINAEFSLTRVMIEVLSHPCRPDAGAAIVRLGRGRVKPLK